MLEALTQHFGCGLPWELLYADDLVIIAESEESLMEKTRKWKEELEMKGLKVNVGKTKVMNCKVGSVPLEESSKWPCGVCSKEWETIQYCVRSVRNGFTGDVAKLKAS